MPSEEMSRRIYEGFPTLGGPMFTPDQLDAIRATDREAIAKASQAWAEPRMGADTARQLADFIRGRA